MTLHQLMITASKTQTYDELSVAIANIQDLIGQDDGGLAGQMFYGADTLSFFDLDEEAKFNQIADYVKTEIAYMDINGETA